MHFLYLETSNSYRTVNVSSKLVMDVGSSKVYYAMFHMLIH